MRALVFGIWLSLQPPPDGYVSLWDLERFPPEAVCTSYMASQADHCVWINKRIETALSAVEREEFQEWWRDLDLRRDCWRCLAAAHDQQFGNAYRRNKLRDLKRWIGRDAYETGSMPCPVPIERFERR